MRTTICNGRFNPCKRCPDRYPTCSDHCQKPAFLEWKDEQERIRAARRKYDETTGYTVAQIRRSRKRCR
jgi:endogenous inhibitor of DNA gyrase (YacG/DUF329 family)